MNSFRINRTTDSDKQASPRSTQWNDVQTPEFRSSFEISILLGFLRKVFFVGLVIFSVIGIGLGVKRFLLPIKTPFVYFEMKVIDDEGHPVAGAGVYHQSKKIGVTDSFGEWRRFMKVGLGSTMTLMIQKNTENEVLKAYKNIAIPPNVPSKGGEIEISSHIKLAKKQGSLPASERSQEALNPVMYDKLWFKAEGVASNKVEQLLSVLQKKAKKVGFQVDSRSSWHIALQLVDNHDAKNLYVRVTAYTPGFSEKEDFLLPLQKDLNKTADSLIKRLQSYAELDPRFKSPKENKQKVF